MVRKKNRVMVEEEGGEIVSLNTGKNIALFDHKGVYFLKVKMLTPTGSNNGASNTSGFVRPGR